MAVGDDRDLSEDLRASFLELQGLLVGTKTFANFLTDLTGLCKRSFRDEVFCSVTLVEEGRFQTAASSDELAEVADEAQYEGMIGPCLTSCHDQAEVVVVDLLAESRFGEYPAKAAALGLRSVVALPMRLEGELVGALNIYSREQNNFGDGSLARARALTAAAAGAVEIARRLTEQAEMNDDLRSALASRRVIDQAIGILMAQESCPADAAFGMLRRASQVEHRKLREVAIEIVTKAGGVPPVEGEVFVPGRRRS